MRPVAPPDPMEGFRSFGTPDIVGFKTSLIPLPRVHGNWIPSIHHIYLIIPSIPFFLPSQSDTQLGRAIVLLFSRKPLTDDISSSHDLFDPQCKVHFSTAISSGTNLNFAVTIAST